MLCHKLFCISNRHTKDHQHLEIPQAHDSGLPVWESSLLKALGTGCGLHCFKLPVRLLNRIPVKIQTWIHVILLHYLCLGHRQSLGMVRDIILKGVHN